LWYVIFDTTNRPQICYPGILIVAVASAALKGVLFIDRRLSRQNTMIVNVSRLYWDQENFWTFVAMRQFIGDKHFFQISECQVSTLTFNTTSSPQICYPAILIVAVAGTSRCVVCRSSIVAQNILLVSRNFTVASAAIRKTFGCSLLSDSLSEIFFPNSKTSILTFDRSSSPAICLRQRFQRRCSETRYASESSSSFP
jgi:hypothetical protein